MSLSDPEGNKPGNSVGYSPFTRIYTNSEEPWRNTYEAAQELRYARNRPGNRTSPLVTIPGTSTKWRAPTSWGRNVIKYKSTSMTTNWIYSATRTDTRTTQASDYIGNNESVNEFLPMFPGGGFTRPEYEYNARAQAITECLLKIGEGKANLAESIATYKQTVNMLAQTSSDLFRALLAAKRGRWGEIPKHLGLNSSKDLSGRYLEWQYGWRPLAGDIHAIMEELRSKEPTAKMLSAKRVIPGNFQYERSRTGQDNRLIEEKIQSNFRTTCHLYGRMSDNWLRRATQFGLTNPASLAWELVPYSFVVDWVMPIGNVLEAFTAPAGLTFVGGYTSCQTQGKKTFTVTGPRFFPNIFGQDGSMEVERFGFRRDALEGWPMPLPYVKSPFSNTHTLNALALFRQLLK